MVFILRQVPISPRLTHIFKQSSLHTEFPWCHSLLPILRLMFSRVVCVRDEHTQLLLHLKHDTSTEPPWSLYKHDYSILLDTLLQNIVSFSSWFHCSFFLEVQLTIHRLCKTCQSSVNEQQKSSHRTSKTYGGTNKVFICTHVWYSKKFSMHSWSGIVFRVLAVFKIHCIS